jgi:hypothetical protein
VLAAAAAARHHGFVVWLESSLEKRWLSHQRSCLPFKDIGVLMKRLIDYSCAAVYSLEMWGGYILTIALPRMRLRTLRCTTPGSSGAA